MTTQRDVDQRVRAYLDDGPTELPDRRYDAVRNDIDHMRQRVVVGPWTELRALNFTRFAIAAAAALLVVVVGINLLPKQDAIGPTTTPTPSPSPSPTPSPIPTTAIPALPGEGPMPAGRYAVTPFVGNDGSICGPVPTASTPSPCVEGTTDDTIRFTFTVPEGWAVAPFQSIWLANGAEPGGASMIFGRGAWLHSDPCLTDAQIQLNGGAPDIPIGPMVDEFTTALAEHPLLDVTAPVDVELAGYSGKYVDLQVPSDISACDAYFPWEGGGALYAQGASQRWHIWILDVDGVRVVIQTFDYAATRQERQDELRAIVDSVQITP